MNGTDPALEAALTRVVEAAVAKATGSSVPYAHVAAICSFFLLLLGVVGKAYLSKDAALTASNKERLDEQKAMAVTLDRATEALREARRAA